MLTLDMTFLTTSTSLPNMALSGTGTGWQQRPTSAEFACSSTSSSITPPINIPGSRSHDPRAIIQNAIGTCGGTAEVAPNHRLIGPPFLAATPGLGMHARGSGTTT